MHITGHAHLQNPSVLFGSISSLHLCLCMATHVSVYMVPGAQGPHAPSLSLHHSWDLCGPAPTRPAIQPPECGRFWGHASNPITRKNHCNVPGVLLMWENPTWGQEAIWLPVEPGCEDFLSPGLAHRHGQLSASLY